ncbi:MAG: hypothetical protein ACRC62_07415 [Microcoleus sp.]
MFYTYKDYISTSYSDVARKKDSLSKRPGNEGIQVEEHTSMPIGEYRWLGAKPVVKENEEVPTQPHSNEFVIAYFEANGGIRQGVKENWRVEIDGTVYTIKKFDGRTTVTMHKTEKPFPIIGFQPGSEL